MSDPRIHTAPMPSYLSADARQLVRWAAAAPVEDGRWPSAFIELFSCVLRRCDDDDVLGVWLGVVHHGSVEQSLAMHRAAPMERVFAAQARQYGR